MSTNLNKDLSADLSKKLSKDLSKELSKGLSKDLGKDISKELDKRKKKQKAKVDDDKPQLLGTNKAVETMFRNALRAELDLIALAATKANIMISLNGVIISALMISGAFIFASSPTFIIPAGIFMFTSLASIFFAILSASPEKSHFFNGFSNWFSAFIKRKAGLGDLREFLDRANQSGDGDEVNLLINKDRMMLSRQEYWEQMQNLIRDRDETYHAMSDQLYWLGQMGARKFKLLNVSYAAFRWGLLVSVLSSLLLHAVLFLYPNVLEKPVSRLSASGMGEFNALYEPSGAQMLPDGNMLIVEDEAKRAMNILTVASDGTLIENAVSNLRLTRSFGRELNDLEGLAADQQDFVYATTSHSSDKNGRRQPAREQLLRFNMSGAKAGNIATITTLRDDLAESPLIAAAIEARTGEEADFDALDIEGLAYSEKTQELLLGLREPVVDNLTMIIPITNPAEMFDNNVAPEFGAPIFLDMRGGGIRSLHFDEALDMFIISNELEDEEGDKFSQVWTWSGNEEDAPVAIELPELLDLKNIEAISTIDVNGESKLVFMADEGDAKKGIQARYVILGYEKFTQ